jgi:gas vesicle protein
MNMGREDGGCGVGAVVLSFFVGGLIGAGVALLVAPKTGEETRKMIKDLADETKEKVEGYIHEAKGKAATYVEKGKGFIEKEKNIIGKAVEAGKEAYEKEKNS